MRRRKNISGLKNEQGVIITLVAVFMLGVVGAMAALSVDVVTIYTARSEAQLAADGAALAGARALANSGMTSNTTDTTLASNAEGLASTVATQVATNNQVGGSNLLASEVTVSFPNAASTSFGTDPQIKVSISKTDLPTFFARIWGTKFITVGASATAEAYNPSGANALGVTTPVAPACVKPWLLPNLDPSGGTTIFDPTTGAITDTGLLGKTFPAISRLQPNCINCGSGFIQPPKAWQYYPGDPATTFPPPTHALPSCVPALTTPYEESVAGCIQTPIACNSTANIDASDYTTRRQETARAVNCLTHANTNAGDQVDPVAAPSPPFQFLAGLDNPITGLAGSAVMVSDSLVTVPVYNSNASAPTSPVTIIGFVQLFLNPTGLRTPTGGPNNGYVETTVINMAGCGADASGQPILGNGASPVAVRLISP